MINKVNNYNKISNSDSNILTAMESFIAVYKEEQLKHKPKIPLSIFCDKKLGVLETITKYLKENLSLKYCQIAKILNRDERTIWVSYHNALKKKKESFYVNNVEQNIPINIFSERNNGPLENLVVYLKDNLHLSFKEISERIKRDYTTVYLSYNNGKKK